MNPIVYHTVLVLSFIFISSCQKPDDNPVKTLFIKDYVPDAVISKNDTMYFDVNQDGKDDFIAFQHKYSFGEIPIFGSVDTSCMLSGPYIFRNDTINKNLKWEYEKPWTPNESDTIYNNKVYLGIRLIDKDRNYYYGWLLPNVKNGDYHSYTVYIDKFVFCKLKNHVILAGQEKD
jgi:hypothetical protein